MTAASAACSNRSLLRGKIPSVPMSGSTADWNEGDIFVMYVCIFVFAPKEYSAHRQARIDMMYRDILRINPQRHDTQATSQTTSSSLGLYEVINEGTLVSHRFNFSLDSTNHIVHLCLIDSWLLILNPPALLINDKYRGAAALINAK